MLKNSRVTGALDTVRLGNALARPGMDTRIWSSLAIVLKVVVDPDEGVFVDVRLMPSRLKETARLGCEYAGAGFGVYFPVEVNDEVLVEAPSGDPDHGLVIVRRLHGAADPPPTQVADHPADALIVVKRNASLRIIASGTGKIVLQVDEGKVLLGDEGADKGVARATDSVGLAATAGIANLQTLLDARYVIGSPGNNLPEGATIGEITTGSSKVNA